MSRAEARGIHEVNAEPMCTASAHAWALHLGLWTFAEFITDPSLRLTLTPMRNTKKSNPSTNCGSGLQQGKSRVVNIEQAQQDPSWRKNII